MTALNDFIQAAASFYGLPVDQLMQGSTLDVSSGDLEVVLRIALTSEDVAGIAQRMQRMALERKVDEAQAELKARMVPVASDADLRALYSALPAVARSAYGSFARYKLAVLAETRRVSEKTELPAHVWLDRNECPEQQKAMAVGMDERGRYAVDPADLTEAQRARLAGTALDVVTSNADDFGGLPG